MDANSFEAPGTPRALLIKAKAWRVLLEAIGVSVFLYVVGSLSRVEEIGLAKPTDDFDPATWPPEMVATLCFAWLGMVAAFAAMEFGMIRRPLREEPSTQEPEDQAWP